MPHILFFLVHVLYFILSWSSSGEGGGGCGHLGQPSNPPRSTESQKGCYVMHLVIQQSVVNQIIYCRCASHGLSLSFVELDCWGSIADLVLFDRDAKTCFFCSTPMTLSPNFNKTLYEVCCIWETHTWVPCYLGTSRRLRSACSMHLNQCLQGQDAKILCCPPAPPHPYNVLYFLLQSQSAIITVHT